MSLVAGIDSSTQSCKVVIRDSETGALVRQGSYPHTDGTEVDPSMWWAALQAALEAAGGIDDVAALSVAAQQHGMVCLADDGSVVRQALLWNDTRSAKAAEELTAELGGQQAWVEAVGAVPVASLTITKLRWLQEHEPGNAERTEAVCLPHDWLTWRLSGSRRRDELVTDRSDASGTGYWSPHLEDYRRDLLEHAFGRSVALPRVLGPAVPAENAGSVVFGPGLGDNAAAALGLGAVSGDVVVSIGTSGTVFGISASPVADPTGRVAGFASATGDFLPLVCTLNAGRVLDATATMLGTDLATMSDLALSVRPGAEGLVLVPYLDGERTPNRPNSTGALHGLTLHNARPAQLARAAVEGMLCGLADALDALVDLAIPVERILLVGGGARSEAVRRLAPAVLGRPVDVPAAGQFVADGAARQAAWVLTGHDQPPRWDISSLTRYDADPVPFVRDRYAGVKAMTAARIDGRTGQQAAL